MPHWLNIAIWILFGLWSVIELIKFTAVMAISTAKYTPRGGRILMLWFTVTTFWLCYKIFG